jgi:tRNA (cytidine32/uridine32-2'-O)-methyltransferase
MNVMLTKDTPRLPEGADTCAVALDPLARVRIVLVETSHPGNMGAAARAMKNSGLSRLYLVRPQRYPHAEARARASGANDVLTGAVVCASLSEALQGTTLVVGTSARARSLRWPHLAPCECAARALQEAATADVAIVFGRERSGLSNTELDRCHYLTSIPTHPAYRSLNLAAAVQIMGYELLLAVPQAVATDEKPAEPRADAEELERFYVHLEETLVALDFLDRRSPRYLMRRLRRVFNRAGLTQNEVNILRGILTAAGRARTPLG